MGKEMIKALCKYRQSINPIIAWVTVGVIFGMPLFLGSAIANDFPTQARAEYVFACMATNGQAQETLAKCSCAIDFIAQQITYEQYVDIETVLRMRLMPGDRAVMFKESAWANNVIADFNELQVDAELECF